MVAMLICAENEEKQSEHKRSAKHKAQKPGRPRVRSKHKLMLLGLKLLWPRLFILNLAFLHLIAFFNGDLLHFNVF